VPCSLRDSSWLGLHPSQTRNTRGIFVNERLIAGLKHDADTALAEGDKLSSLKRPLDALAPYLDALSLYSILNSDYHVALLLRRIGDIYWLQLGDTFAVA